MGAYKRAGVCAKNLQRVANKKTPAFYGGGGSQEVQRIPHCIIDCKVDGCEIAPHLYGIFSICVELDNLKANI